ncbi:MAG TPA: ABC transporter ATP-binding protein [Burkholderiales bacterium]|nr:ABC transporter ATP-binding protein [Burkholderiales bacterium]
MSILAVKGLTKSFGGVRAVSGVSFSVDAGELLAMIGPNGAGKTTCFNLVNGQLQPDAGEVLFQGRKTRGMTPRELYRLGVGRTFQITATFGSMSVRENVQLALLSHAKRLGSPFSSFSGAISGPTDELLEGVGMRRQADKRCAELAYGDLKRVELAVALAGRPRLLLMDEPTAGMAAAERHMLMKLVEGTAKEENISVLFTEHDMDIVFGHADRVIVLSEGELIAQGSPAAVRADPLVRRVYLGEEAARA